MGRKVVYYRTFVDTSINLDRYNTPDMRLIMKFGGRAVDSGEKVLHVANLIKDSVHLRFRINKPSHSGPSADSIDHSLHSGQFDLILPEFEFLEDRG